METEVETKARTEKKAHVGRNIRSARQSRGKTQEDLAILLNTNSRNVYNIEQQETVEETVLVQIANILEYPLEFFKKPQPDDMIEKYVIENNTFSPSMTNSDTSSNNNQNDYVANNQENNTYNYGNDPKYTKLCEELSKVHEKVIKIINKDLSSETAKNKKLEKELERMRKELDQYKKEEK